MHLKEQFLNLKLTHLVQGLNPSLDTLHEFYFAFQSSLVATKNLLCELHLHNHAIPNDKEWNPLLYVGDIQLAYMSWVQNELNRENQARPYRHEEVDIPLPIRPEARDVCHYYYDWPKITKIDARSENISP